MATFKEFIKLTEAGAGLPGSGSTGTALQRNRPGSQNMFSPTVTYGNTIKDKQQEKFAWKNNIYSHILHLESTHSLITEGGKTYLPLEMIRGGEGYSPWHKDAVDELMRSRVLSSPVTISIPSYELEHAPNAHEQQGLIRQNGSVFLPISAGIPAAEIVQRGWSTSPHVINAQVAVFPINIERARETMAALADWRNTLNMTYNAFSGMSQPTLRTPPGVEFS